MRHNNEAIRHKTSLLYPSLKVVLIINFDSMDGSKHFRCFQLSHEAGQVITIQHSKFVLNQSSLILIVVDKLRCTDVTHGFTFTECFFHFRVVILMTWLVFVFDSNDIYTTARWTSSQQRIPERTTKCRDSTQSRRPSRYNHVITNGRSSSSSCFTNHSIFSISISTSN